MAAARKPPRRRAPATTQTTRDLTRDKVIDAGLDLIDREGPDAVTMRRLADHLGVTPMALYNHVSSKTDLLRAVAERALSEAEFDAGHADWREQVKACFRVFRALCLRHPGLARLLETPDVAPAAVFSPMDVTLRALRWTGCNDQDRLRAYFTLVGFTLSQTSYQSRGPFPDLEPSDRVRAERLAGRGYPSVESLRMPATWDFDAAFEFGLSVIVRGIEAVAGARR
jgi:TetR/AcrR family transcriptional regulator, tetracycline repressor protein